MTGSQAKDRPVWLFWVIDASFAFDKKHHWFPPLESGDSKDILVKI
jgi:hypothetical protein